MWGSVGPSVLGWGVLPAVLSVVSVAESTPGSPAVGSAAATLNGVSAMLTPAANASTRRQDFVETMVGFLWQSGSPQR
ncbi:hypothetical protein HH308_02670 [Gordonia sp. TBRC 11910]|uniref:Uncharacterized protein n=1 Tax=Gordonia asplenii TaxID=2725283 RepID=A0A848KTA5_9ACTN|nr:hypothetical protein [Gordonia asplenii]NMO00115.1 hypothetical protein [Gordonia asplenii]